MLFVWKLGHSISFLDVGFHLGLQPGSSNSLLDRIISFFRGDVMNQDFQTGYGGAYDGGFRKTPGRR